MSLDISAEKFYPKFSYDGRTEKTALSLYSFFFDLSFHRLSFRRGRHPDKFC